MSPEQAAAIDKAARERAEQWLAAGPIPESVQRRIRPLLTHRARAA